MLGNRAQTVNDQPFAGKLADVRIYSAALSDIEILEIKNGNDNIANKINLVGSWLTNADDYLDYSINNNHGGPSIGDGSFEGSTYSTEAPV